MGKSVVYLTNDEQFEKLLVGKPALQPIGFPKEDIFCLPANKSITEGLNSSRLSRWDPND
jgi:hypothetical protein